MDLHAVKLVVQFDICDSIPTLSQRFGRGARDPNISAICILLVPLGYFVDERIKRLQTAELRRLAAEKLATGKSGRKRSATVLMPTSGLASTVDGVTTMPVLIEAVGRSGNGEAFIYIPPPLAEIVNGKQKRNGDAFATTLEMDAWINAGQLPHDDPHHGCRRKVEMQYYGTDKICTFIGFNSKYWRCLN